jgi:hypothetical protein
MKRNGKAAAPWGDTHDLQPRALAASPAAAVVDSRCARETGWARVGGPALPALARAHTHTHTHTGKRVTRPLTLWHAVRRVRERAIQLLTGGGTAAEHGRAVPPRGLTSPLRSPLRGEDIRRKATQLLSGQDAAAARPHTSASRPVAAESERGRRARDAWRQEDGAGALERDSRVAKQLVPSPLVRARFGAASDEQAWVREEDDEDEAGIGLGEDSRPSNSLEALVVQKFIDRRRGSKGGEARGRATGPVSGSLVKRCESRSLSPSGRKSSSPKDQVKRTRSRSSSPAQHEAGAQESSSNPGSGRRLSRLNTTKHATRDPRGGVRGGRTPTLKSLSTGVLSAHTQLRAREHERLDAEGQELGGGGTRTRFLGDRRGSDDTAPSTVQPLKSMGELEKEVLKLQGALQASLQAEQDARDAETWARGMIDALQLELDEFRSQGQPRGLEGGGRVEDGNMAAADDAPKVMTGSGKGELDLVEMKKEELASLHVQLGSAVSVVSSLKQTLESERSKVEALEKAADALQREKDAVQRAHEALEIEHAALRTQHLATCDQLRNMSQEIRLESHHKGDSAPRRGKDSECERCGELTSSLETTKKRLEATKSQLALAILRHQAHDKDVAKQLAQALASFSDAESALADRDARVATLLEQAEAAEKKCALMKLEVCACAVACIFLRV